jgi:hypothetical protein
LREVKDASGREIYKEVMLGDRSEKFEGKRSEGRENRIRCRGGNWDKWRDVNGR